LRSVARGTVAGHRLGDHQRLPRLHGGADIAQEPQDDRILVIKQHPHQRDAVMSAGQRVVEKTAAVAARALAKRLARKPVARAAGNRRQIKQ
jgi:hypothetical protein